MKRLSREEKSKRAIKDIINKMFIIAGHDVTYDDIIGREDPWYMDWEMTLEENEEWKKWGKKYLMKNLRLYAREAEKQMLWISVQYGLKISDLSFKDGK